MTGGQMMIKLLLTTSHHNNQCWRKLLLKVMHYNIALLPKKITNNVT